MKSLKIIQLGDVHYPDASLLADAQDCAMPSEIVDVAAAHPIRNTMKAVLEVCQQDPAVGGIFLCGDLTSRGDLPGYQRCVRYFRSSLRTMCATFWNESRLHVVPGNHDIHRSKCDPSGADLFQKFLPLIACWDQPGDPQLSVRSVRRSTVMVDSAKAELFSLNSCLGCGERRHFPNELQHLQDLVRTANPDITPEREFALFGEQLDTPAFAEEHITSLLSSISSLPNTEAVLISAHHNILPQALVRIAMYTEVLNGGLVRSRLAQCQRRVIYCHGHIHDEPVDIVSTPTDPSGGVIVVSAPPFTDGFNVLEIQYGVNGRPLGLIVHPHRIRKDGMVTENQGDILRIPLVTAADIVECAPDRLGPILHALPRDSFCKANDVLEEARRTLGIQIRPQTLADLLLDGEWLGSVQILNRDRLFHNWHIRRSQA